MFLFYTTNVTATTVELDEEESKHCLQVLRKKTGDTIHLVDGKGTYYEAVISITGKKNCIANITLQQPNFNTHPFHLHIAIAPTKNMDRLEWFVEKATEFGINEITPLLCQRSERKILRTDRLEKIALSAMKQSLKGTLPTIRPLTPFKEALSIVPSNTLKYIAQGAENVSLKNNYEPLKNVYILIGPEGDFTPAELQLASRHDFLGVNLGKSRLRTETAGVAACHTFHLLNE